MLNERELGVFKGKNKCEFNTFCYDNGFSFENCKTDVIENYEDVFMRMNLFKKKILEKYKNKSILVVSHSSVLVALLAFLLGKSSDLMYVTSLQNASISCIDLDDCFKPAIKYINSTSHLFTGGL